MKTEVITNTKPAMKHAYCTNAAHINKSFIFFSKLLSTYNMALKRNQDPQNKGGYPN